MGWRRHWKLQKDPFDDLASQAAEKCNGLIRSLDNKQVPGAKPGGFPWSGTACIPPANLTRPSELFWDSCGH